MANLLSADEAKKYLPNLTGAGEDTDLDTFVARCEATIAEWCGYEPNAAGAAPNMGSASRTLYLTGYGGRDLDLEEWPVTAITSVEDDVTLDFDGSTYLVDSGDYNLLQLGKQSILRLTSTAAWAAWSDYDEHEIEGCIKVVCTQGYSAAPAGLKHQIGRLLKHAWGGRKTQGKTSRSAKGGSISVDEKVEAEIRAALGPFKLPKAIL